MSKRTNHLAIGIMAHVDSGKTTLSEAILYQTKAIRSLGRVDHKTAFLDHNPIERSRGITVFSKEACFVLGEKYFTLLDTPGHGDFVAEMERALAVMDYGILVISGPDGVQSHTLTLWKLLKKYRIPTIIFVNKMDRAETTEEILLEELRKDLLKNDEGCLEKIQDVVEGLTGMSGGTVAGIVGEEIASTDERLMEEFFEMGSLSQTSLQWALKERKFFPVFFGSALKMEGISSLLQFLQEYAQGLTINEESNFGGRVYKISRDKKGNRLTHLKITSGSLRNKMVLEDGQRVEQIRLYHGESFQNVNSVETGMVCAVLGLSHSYAGQGLGIEMGQVIPMIEPSLTYRVNLEEGVDAAIAFQKLKLLEEEEPSLHLVWQANEKEIYLQVMGDLELEILKQQISQRLEMNVSFGSGRIIYKETIAAPVIGVGHYEPLRHYAEVHLLLEPLPRGSGLFFDQQMREETLDKNWQKLVMSHLREKSHKGVLTGSELTDLKISLINGKGHAKHTEGGDFRQATYRAVRQGLRKAESVLLEPIYEFQLKLPTENIGRALTDLQQLGAKASLTESNLISGTGPVSGLKDYAKEILAYTKGRGIWSVLPAGYDVCQNSEEVIDQYSYDPEADLENPTGSIFCSHGAGQYVGWDQVDEMAHLPVGEEKKQQTMEEHFVPRKTTGFDGNDELEEIFLRTYGKSKRTIALERERESKGSRRLPAATDFPMPKWKKDEEEEQLSGFEQRNLILVDGYNVIFSWTELKLLAQNNLDSAREALIDCLENYAVYRKIDVLLVFDGYKLEGNPGTHIKHEKIRADAASLEVVYTKERETADRYIEKTVFQKAKKQRILVITSDQSVQMATLGDGALRMSSREFEIEVSAANREIKEQLKKQGKDKYQPFAETFNGV